jgi:2-dehydro-3-deoxyphosphogluconate aldolase / (4S)-4-hydroxy-2-oxoglutarate aldolase
VRFMPTGGITAESLPDWLGIPAVAACGGTWIAPADAIARGDTDLIRTRAAQAVAVAAATPRQS